MSLNAPFPRRSDVHGDQRAQLPPAGAQSGAQSPSSSPAEGSPASTGIFPAGHSGPAGPAVPAFSDRQMLPAGPVGTGVPGTPATISPLRATWLVARREILSAVRTKSFIISTAVLLIAVFALAVVGGITGNRGMSAASVAVVAETESVTENNPTLDPVLVDTPDGAIALVRDGAVDAAVVPTADPEAWPGYKLVALEEVPLALTLATTVSPDVELLEPDTSDTGLQYLLAIVFGIIFMMSVMTFGSTIAQNTVIEKQTRTVELLLSAVPASVLLAGKILGNSILAICQTAAIIVAGILGLVVTGQTDILALLGAPAAWFVVFYVFGFVLFAAIFAASASLVSRIEDTGAVLSPVMMLTMMPYFIVILFGQNPAVMMVASYVPFTSVVAMPVRMIVTGVAWWEPLVSLAILILSDAIVIAVAARIYRASVLQTGARLKVRDAWKGQTA